MNQPRHIAVIDIGKTNAKLALVDLDTLSEISVVTRPNSVLPGPPWPHFDVDGHWAFLLEALARFHREHGVDTISVTTHGACVVLLNQAGELAAPVLDYEHRGPDALAAEYDAVRPEFNEAGSPRLGMGLNVGAQLFWQFQQDPELYGRTHSILTYPQYWSHRLTGIAATDVTSLGCHTDLWNPDAADFSSLVDRLGIRKKMAPARASGDVLGPILPEIAALTGLAPDTPVICGIHDSNASLLPHIKFRIKPFSVVSSGTWVIAMAVGGQPALLNPDRDTLINVSAFGRPVPSARFMGGREFELIQEGASVQPTDDDLDRVLSEGIMLLPAVEPNSGPFRGLAMSWTPAEPAIGTGCREVALSFYLALMTAECLKMVGASGETIVEGPFARNLWYLQMLQVATQRPVVASESMTGTSVGAAMLFMKTPVELSQQEIFRPAAERQYALYASQWQKLTSPDVGRDPSV
jgi:sugar (pentulose or hexulose) kinase